MSDVSPLLIAAIFGTFFLAGLVKGVTGMGLPTVAMGMLGALISPLTAASLLLLPSFVTNVWQLLAGANLIAMVLRLWPMMLAISAGTLLGSAWIARVDSTITGMLLGVALIGYSLFTLVARPCVVPHHMEAWLSPIVGAITGLVTGGTGVFVIPAVPYLQSLELSKDDLVQALGLSFTISTIALGAGLAAHGAFRTDSLALSAIAIAPALGGMRVGQFMRARISPTAFRRGFLICLMLLGGEMVLRAFI